MISCSSSQSDLKYPKIKSNLAWLALCLLIRPVSAFLVDFIKPHHRFFWNLTTKEYRVYTLFAILPVAAYLCFKYFSKNPKAVCFFKTTTLALVIVSQFYFYFITMGFYEVAVFILLSLYSLFLLALALGAKLSK